MRARNVAKKFRKTETLFAGTLGMYALRYVVHILALDAHKVMITLDVTGAFLHIRSSEGIAV